jgi:hypothetical protein
MRTLPSIIEFHLGLGINFVADKDDPLFAGFTVKVFAFTVGADIPVENVDTFISGFRFFNSRALSMEWVQHTREQYGRSGSREPTH